MHSPFVRALQFRVAAFVTLSLAVHAAPFLGVSNLAQPIDGFLTTAGKTSGYDYQAVYNFTTGNTASDLVFISLPLVGFGTAPSHFAVALYSAYSVNGPAGLVANLTGSSAPVMLDDYLYTPASPVQLQPNTTYYILTSAIGTPDQSGFNILRTTSKAEDPQVWGWDVTGWTIGDNRGLTNNGGLSWYTSVMGNPDVPEFAVKAAYIPDAGSSVVLLVFALGATIGLRPRERRRR